ncbi:uncharacterized protein L969DRAFT_79402 [Mixia osmundae IAM 14324]|uniref:NAD(P)-binding protein n=1 Tax=Mixia osmundae (strain CBS 9802 / IAM 14324 / JCM 22182 / KY 12970) TaxID=764103 RepID=G7E2K4_MIXOS|nr:uncharacterized protein L969DRAFT_79402 [Mixia osmundae IAM 14324]KEI36933.1 hypothetical protein L969DRAFT_79402 [Mixia osmundae IAM 14324]GAA97064.1 hypothetical protein E5Q_03739 [Mixia osmundae IAM 14324]
MAKPRSGFATSSDTHSSCTLLLGCRHTTHKIMTRIFLVTGTSSGFGAELVKYVLEQGDYAVATSRDSSKLEKPAKATDDNYLAVDMDVTSPDSIKAAFDKGLKKFGSITHVINNAGFGLSGEFESLPDKLIRQQCEINFFGVLNVTREALEVMREKNKQKGGFIQQITSIGGQTGVPLFSIYCATKWAVEGFTEALAQELKPEWNITLQCIEPGGFATGWSSHNMIYPSKSDKCQAYDHLDGESAMKKRHGTQVGDPAKAGKAMYDFAVMSNPPFRAVLGSDAHGRIMKKIDDYQGLYTKFESQSKATDRDDK